MDQPIIRNATQETSRDLGVMFQIFDLKHDSRKATRKPEGFSAVRRRLREKARGSKKGFQRDKSLWRGCRGQSPLPGGWYEEIEGVSVLRRAGLV